MCSYIFHHSLRAKKLKKKSLSISFILRSIWRTDITTFPQGIKSLLQQLLHIYCLQKQYIITYCGDIMCTNSNWYTAPLSLGSLLWVQTTQTFNQPAAISQSWNILLHLLRKLWLSIKIIDFIFYKVSCGVSDKSCK